MNNEKQNQESGNNRPSRIEFEQDHAEALTGDRAGFKVRWLSNTYNPKGSNAEMCVARSFNESQEEAWQHHQNWLKGKIIGDPKATDYYTVEQLKAQNMVGVYIKCEPEELRGQRLMY